MFKKQLFFFTNNALSKGMLLESLWHICTGKARKRAAEAHRRIASFFGLKPSQVYFFGAGRMGVYTLLKSLQLRKDEHVIAAGYTCVVLTNAVKFAGCNLRYVDISKEDFNLNTAALNAAITDKTRVLIAPHNFGIPYDDLERIKAAYPQLVIIEDVAHSFGSRTSSGKLCGTIGDAAFFSLEYSKPLTTGLGGIMLINNEELNPPFRESYEALPTMPKVMGLKILISLAVFNLTYTRATGFFQLNSIRVIRLLGLLYGTSHKEMEGEHPAHYPVKLRPSLASLLLPQLERIQSINQKRTAQVHAFSRAFAPFNDIEPLPLLGEVMVRYPILFKVQVPQTLIDAIKRDASAAGFTFGVWFNDVVHPAGSYRYGYEAGSCPVGEYIAPRIINLPVNAYHPPGQKDLEVLKTIFKKHGIQ